MIAKVIIDIANSEVDRVFDYLCEDDAVEGSRVKVPFGAKVIDGYIMEIGDKSDYPVEKLKSIISVYEEPPVLTKESMFLVNSLSSRYACPKALVLRLFIPSEMRLGKVRELYKRTVSLSPCAKREDIPSRAKKQIELFDLLKEKGTLDFSVLCERFSPSSVHALEKAGIVVFGREQVRRNPYVSVDENYLKRDLLPAQKNAVESITNAKKTITLLHGVTGSGKTEVYLTLIENALKEGKSAIFLVPEISLTPQMLRQLRARFKGECAILHSGLSAGERFDEWWRLRSGQAHIAIGARSAIFAPLEDVGVIIIDEEHDGSYFSETAPRYSTAEVAKLRAEFNGAKLVLGSATPNVEDYKKAKEGEYGLVSMPERVNGKSLPEIKVADMRREVMAGNNSPFSRTLVSELEATLKRGEQAIIFLNRRGYSQSVICQECGYVAKCEDCDVTLNYHSDEDVLMCHYCGRKYKMLSCCPECSGKHIRYFGTGTQKVVGELNALFPSARITRMDNDTTSGKEGHYKILSEFASKKADILVGTQMIAKGHDFPSVTLVGILDADMSLHFSDYRSGERTFQLLTQVAGRSGRAEEKGKVVLQTYSPDNNILQFATRYDYNNFYKYEIAVREATLFPPFSTIVRVMVTSEKWECALEALKEVYFALQELYKANFEKFIFFNKMKSPVKRIQTKYRLQVLMRITDRSLLPPIYEICSSVKEKNAYVYVEENPASLS